MESRVCLGFKSFRQQAIAFSIMLLVCAVVIPACMAQPAQAKDITDYPTMDAKAIKVNKEYTGVFEKAGDRDAYRFVSGGGSYKVVVTLTGCKSGSSDGYNLFDYGKMNMQTGGADISRGWDLWSTTKPQTNKIGAYKKGSIVVVVVMGNYKGKYKVKIVGKGSKSSTKKIYALAYGTGGNGENGSDDNVRIMKKAFKGLKVKGYKLAKVSAKNVNGLNMSKFEKKLDKVFSKATKNDICIVYYCGHSLIEKGSGKPLGLLIGPAYHKILGTPIVEGKHDEHIAWKKFLNVLGSHIKGKIIFLPEVCNSGCFVKSSVAKQSKVAKRISIITATDSKSEAHNQEKSGAYTVTKGAYTMALAKGLGYGVKYADRAETLHDLYLSIRKDSNVVQNKQNPRQYNTTKKPFSKIKLRS